MNESTTLAGQQGAFPGPEGCRRLVVAAYDRGPG